MNHSNAQTINTYAEFKPFFEEMGKRIINPGFKLYPIDNEVLYKLYVYFSKDNAEANRLNISLRKGIILTGKVGCGKTSWMKLFKRIIVQDNQYIVKSCHDVTIDFMTGNYDVIRNYGKQSFDRDNNPKTYCFDDLGIENSKKLFGNESNVMEEIIVSRYDQFIDKKLLTHFTTNLNSSEIENQYGLRVRSRLREMCNLFYFDESSPDKRA